MKRKKIIVGRIGFIAIGLFLLSLYLKETFQYAFFNREQQQLFLFDSDYVSGLLLQPRWGGTLLVPFSCPVFLFNCLECLFDCAFASFYHLGKYGDFA